MYYKTKKHLIRDVISQPIVWSVIIPILILDIWVEIYHRTCFPLYDIPYVKRSDYIKIDRQKLKYLSILEKMGCMYCGYANGFLLYAAKIAGETERHWCAIRHQPKEGFVEPKHHTEFFEYGDAEGVKNLGK